MCRTHQLTLHLTFGGFQAAAEKAPKLSKEEMRRLRQERDPHFARGAKAGKGQQPSTQGPAAGAEGTPSQPGRMGPPPAKRKKGLGFEVQLPHICTMLCV